MRAVGARGRLLQQFVDAQLLISAQATAARATALFGAAALDLARAGVFHVRGGVGGIAETLVEAVRSFGGEVLFRAQVERIEAPGGQVRRVHTRKKGTFEAERVVANLTPWNIGALLGEDAPASLRRSVAGLPPEWGAFTLYLGVDDDLIPEGFAEHHQIFQHPDRPMGEGNTLFLSVNPTWDEGRAPAGQRVITMSTHTRADGWWALRNQDGRQATYDERVAEYTERFLGAAEQLLPGIRGKTRLLLHGTPVTFERYTRRHLGVVGGFPQHSLFSANRPRLPVRGLWMVGDSIFPGQSTAGVSLGALRVADAILGEGKPH